MRTVRSVTSAGKPVRVASFARWDDACQQAGLPVVRITAPPAHGVLATRQAILVVGSRLFEGTTNCRDKRIPGVELWFTPAEGYRGTDRMEYEVDTGQGPRRSAASVDVR